MSTIGFQLAYGNPIVVHALEHTTANSFTAGDLVHLSDSGHVRLAENDAEVWGVAAKDAKGTADTVIPVYVISPEQVWRAQLDTTSDQAQLGRGYGINVATPGSQSVDIGDTGATSVVILDFFEPEDTALGQVLVKFAPGIIQSIVG